jgi:signal transduction histidine kinase
MKLLTKCLLLFGLSSAFQLALLGTIVAAQREADAASTWNLHSKSVLAEAADLNGAMLMEAARIRTSVILADRHPLHRPETWRNAQETLVRMERLVADNPVQLARLAQLRREIEAFRVSEVEARALMEAGNFTEMTERYRRVGSQTVLNNLRRPLEAFVADEKRLEAQRSARFASSLRHLQLLQIGALGASLLATLPALFLFRRDIGRRLHAVSGNVERLAEGRALAAPMGGHDELARLDQLLHDTARRLRVSEASAAQSRQELERRSTELAATNGQLRRERQDNEMFIYSVSHDLRAPLVNMQGFSREIMHSCGDLRARLAALPLSDAQRDALRDVVEEDIAVSLGFLLTAVERTSAIIDALLRLSRAGQVRLAPQMVDIDNVVRRVVDSMHADVAARGADVLVQPLPPAWVDPTAADQIFANLIGNALAYLDPARPGRVEIGALPADEHRNGTKRAPDGSPLRAVRTGATRTYFVKDNGLGIPREHMGRLFMPFQRLHSERAKGEGIGLALVQRTVERHGGRIWVESIGGRGAMFMVTLPVEPAPSPANQEYA